jgi:hypothetical protein
VFRDGLSASNYNHTSLRIPKEVNAKAVPLLAVRAFLEMRFQGALQLATKGISDDATDLMLTGCRRLHPAPLPEEAQCRRCDAAFCSALAS